MTSLLVGKQCGTAPDARVYYVAARGGVHEEDYVKGLNWIIEKNKSLPLVRRIRVVSVSAAPGNAGTAQIARNLDISAGDIDVSCPGGTSCDRQHPVTVTVGQDFNLLFGIFDTGTLGFFNPGTLRLERTTQMRVP